MERVEVNVWGEEDEEVMEEISELCVFAEVMVKKKKD